MLLKRHSIIVRGATAKRGSANTPKKWKPRRQHDVWRSDVGGVIDGAFQKIAPLVENVLREQLNRLKLNVETGKLIESQ
jgi:hypothetical protein